MFSSKKRINFEEYQRINTDVTSEMFLAIMVLLQNNFPCSENFYRYKKNYENHLEGKGDGPTASSENKPAQQLIASPTLMSKLSPI